MGRGRYLVIGTSKRKLSKAERKAEDTMLAPTTETPVKDLLRWPVSLAFTAAAVVLRSIGFRGTVWVLVPSLILLPLAQSQPWKELTKQRIAVLTLLCQWMALVTLWPWWFSSPGTWGVRALLWPTTPAFLLAWITVWVGAKKKILWLIGGAEKVNSSIGKVKAQRFRETLLDAAIDAKALPPESKLLTYRPKKNGKESWVFQLPRGISGLDIEKLREKMASLLTTAPKNIRATHAEEDHSKVIITRVSESWQVKPKLPAPKPGVLSMGYLDDGQIVEFNIDNESAQHVMFSGATGSGKSNSIVLWICMWLIQRLFGMRSVLWLGDPSGGSELGPYFPWADKRAISPEGCVRMLTAAYDEMLRRYAEMGVSEADLESDNFDASSFSRLYEGDTIIVAIDEFPALLDEDQKATLKALKAIVMRGRRARIFLGVGQQSPRANAMGGDSKAQFPTRICHQVADGTESNIGLRPGLVGKGIDASTIRETGRAYAILPRITEVPEIQFFKAPTPGELTKLVSPSPKPFTPTPSPGEGHTPSPSSGHESDPESDDGEGVNGEGSRDAGADLPEPDWERLERELEEASTHTHEQTLARISKHARALYDVLALADAPLSASETFRRAGIPMGKNIEVLGKLVKAGLIEQNFEGGWQLLGARFDEGLDEA